jgi:hypothetical protein
VNLRQPNLRPSSVFDPQEPVIQSHPLLAQAPVPRFGDSGEWNLNGVIRRPARLPSCAWMLVFSHELAEPSWNLLAREVSMIMLNPRHPSVTAAGLSLKPAPAHPKTVINELSQLRHLVRLAEANGLPPHLTSWHDNDLRRLIRGLREQLSGPSGTTSQHSRCCTNTAPRSPAEDCAATPGQERAPEQWPRPRQTRSYPLR